MKHEIEVFKGQTIFYDEDKDKFVCDISVEDNSKSTARKSLKDVRSEINAFIKLNVDFKPMRILFESWGRITPTTIWAVRTGGDFVVGKTEDGSKSFVSLREINEKGKQFNPDFVEMIARQDKEQSEMSLRHTSERIDAIAKLVPIDLSNYVV